MPSLFKRRAKQIRWLKLAYYANSQLSLDNRGSHQYSRSGQNGVFPEEAPCCDGRAKNSWYGYGCVRQRPPKTSSTCPVDLVGCDQQSLRRCRSKRCQFSTDSFLCPRTKFARSHSSKVLIAASRFCKRSLFPSNQSLLGNLPSCWALIAAAPSGWRIRSGDADFSPARLAGRITSSALPCGVFPTVTTGATC